MSNQRRQNRKKFHLLSLIINNLRFFLLSTDILKLPSNHRISEPDSQTSCQEIIGFKDHAGTNVHHDSVHFSDVSFDGEGAFSVNLDELLEHVVSWDSYLVEGGPAVVFAVVAKFWSHVASFDARHVFMVF